MAPPTATATTTESSVPQITTKFSKLTVNSTPFEDATNRRRVLSKEELNEIREASLKSFSAKTLAEFGTRGELGEDGLIRTTQHERTNAKYPEWLPVWNPAEKYEQYEEFEFEDKGLKAHPELKNLFPDGVEYKKKDLTPKFGSEIEGIQLSSLSDEAKNDLAKYVAERGVVIFRKQDFASKGPIFAAQYGDYFGPAHIHQTSGAPESTSKIHVVFREENSPTPPIFSKKNKRLAFHSDISFEKQPAGLSIFGVLEGPVSGGDTGFVDTQQAYERLSPQFQKILEGLTATHQGVKQVEASKTSGFGVFRREPAVNSHPVVRTIPSTGKKALYVNSGFLREIDGLKEEESKAILSHLNDLLHTSVDLHVRANWEEGTIAVWDNRRTEHTPIFDWEGGARRHMFRITPRAEVPYLEK